MVEHLGALLSVGQSLLVYPGEVLTLTACGS